MRQNAYDYSYELKKARQKKISRNVLLVVSVFLFISLFLNYLLFPVHVGSSSMESDVAKGGTILVCPMDKVPARGQVVYLTRMDNLKLKWYESFGNTLAKFFTLQKYAPFGHSNRMTGNDSIRRVVALPGDSYYMKDYVLYVKPRGQSHYLTEFELASKPYDIHIYSVPVEWDGMGSSSELPETTLGEKEYFVLADDRVEAIDSRVYGGVDSSRIKGRVLIQTFPLNKIRFF